VFCPDKTGWQAAPENGHGVDSYSGRCFLIH
jgi:hypothetical protein